MKQFGPDVQLEQPAFVHESVELFGSIHVGKDVSLWPHVVARSENFAITIGEGSNVQDFVMLHVGAQTGVEIGQYCSITHHCTLHGCRIGNNCLIGINSTIMDGCIVGDNSIIAGHTFLREGTEIPANSIVMGTPGKVVRQHNNYLANRINALMYIVNGKAYARGEYRSWSDPATDIYLQKQREQLEQELARQSD